jgi:hypothetical protein
VTKRIATALLFLSMAVVAVAYASAWLPGGAPGWAPWLLAVGMSTCMVSMMVMGAAREGRIGKLVFPFAFVFLVLVAGFGFALAYPGIDPADPVLWFGLPPRAAVVLYVVGFLPLFVVPIAYALTFDGQTLRPEDLERIRRHRTSAEPHDRPIAPGRAAEPTGAGR